MLTRSRSVVLLSGGLDSAANLAFCAAWDAPVLCLTVDYGQKAALREIEAACELAAYYGIKHETLDLKWLGALGGSSLTEAARAVPGIDPSQLDDQATAITTAKAVWVPNRNGLLINAAACIAERLEATRVVVGFNSEEAATFPDNSADYLEAATRALAYSTSNQVRVYCYSTLWDKRRIVAELRKLEKPFPFDKIWSCYQSGPHPCGGCESCRRLARALQG